MASDGMICDGMTCDMARADGEEVAARLGRLLDPLRGSRLVLAGAGSRLGGALLAVLAALGRDRRPAEVAAFDRLPPAGPVGRADWVVNLMPDLPAAGRMLDLARDGGARGMLSVVPPGEARREAEALCATRFRFARLPVTVVRPWGVYGPGRTSWGAPLALPWDGGDTAWFCYAADAAEACLTLLTMPEAAGQAFDLAAPEAVTPDGLAAAVAAAAGRRLPVVLGGRPMPGLRPEPSRLARLAGFVPRIGLRDGLARTLAAAPAAGARAANRP